MSALNKVVIINKLSCDTSYDSDSVTWFYPLQTCSDVCGVIVVCMCTVLCDLWDPWLIYGSQMETVATCTIAVSMQIRLILIL